MPSWEGFVRRVRSSARTQYPSLQSVYPGYRPGERMLAPTVAYGVNLVRRLLAHVTPKPCQDKELNDSVGPWRVLNLIRWTWEWDSHG